MKSAIIESGRADFALREVKRIKGTSGAKHKEYKSYCKKFPSMVQINGLAASVAFLKEKGGTYLHLIEHIDGWLKICDPPPGNTDLLTYICGMHTAQYRSVTKEVLALFSWLRRFAAGLIEGEE